MPPRGWRTRGHRSALSNPRRPRTAPSRSGPAGEAAQPVPHREYLGQDSGPMWAGQPSDTVIPDPRKKGHVSAAPCLEWFAFKY